MNATTQEVETTTNPADLVALAKEAYAASLLERERQDKVEAEQERLEQAKTLKYKMKHYLSVDVEPEGPRVEVAGLTFGATRWGVNLIRPCAKCGDDAYIDVQSLASLGEALEQAPSCHDWEAHREPRDEPVSVAEPTPLETLGQALIDYLEANGYAGSGYE